MSSNLKPFSRAASVMLALVAIAHLLRVIFAMEVLVDGVSVSPAVSVIATFIAASLSFMVWRESRSG